MTPLISARRAAEDFARLVDGSPVDVADRYEDLTACVDLLRAQPVPDARPEFVADLRSRLLSAADTLLVAAPTQTRPAPVVTLAPATRRHRRLGVAAAAFVIVGGTAGVAAAAESSLPGDALYPVKRGIESAQVSLNTSDAAKGLDLIAQAGTRLDEIDGLMGDANSTSRITDTLAAYERSARSGADLLFVAYQRDGNGDDLAQLRDALTSQLDQLQQLAGQAPPTTQPGFTSAAALLTDLDQQARVLCGNCGPDTGISDFTNLSSAPALTTLLTQPAAAAAAAQQQEAAEALAKKAGEIASLTPKTPVGDATGTSGGTTSSGSGTSLPGVSSPSLPSPKDTVTTSVGGVTTGVQGLLAEVDTSTGGILTPVTDSVNSVLDPVTGLLGN
jgi:hypothetical protein